ncbi:DUF4139 domain-containing protein [Caulobacter sp. NIBR1757]|uniref:DUF4139 domain-containing protein n=1 Tax=Caulobacter sp. NIBR1757 TaxID=3016000 RepID=UPI0022F0EC2F|nr:DUF4139 domain-containing protein [Caulobacter sp. NIBR1757]WGM39599.1 hypothetical protein AMEJIAPC_02524 [Caulobacter sp. NIBR1757]
MRKFLLAASALALAATAASAQDRTLSVTIYNSGQTLVEDVRTETLKAGRQRIEFKDVSPRIRAETVALSAPGIGIVEQNFDYDLLSPDTLMEKAVGRTVKIVRTNPATGVETTEVAKVLAVNGGVVLQIGDRIEVLRDDGLPTRVIFDKVPDNLRARPTLSVTVDAAEAGPRQAKLNYLTTGLGWKADYVALFDEKSGKLDLQGWVTLTNTSGTTYENAEVQLVAGNVSSGGRPGYPQQPRGPAGVTSAGKGGVGPQPVALADYYLYPLAERTTIAQNQTKQVSFLDILGAPAAKVYRVGFNWFQSQEQPVSAEVLLEFGAVSAGKVASPMPAGTVRVYMRDQAGDPKFIGENAIGHTPAGSTLSIKTGDAFDVTLQPAIVSTEDLGKKGTRWTMKYVLRNARPEPVEVSVRQGGLWINGKVLKESHPSKRLDYNTLDWTVPVPANGETELTFTLETGY